MCSCHGTYVAYDSAVEMMVSFQTFFSLQEKKIYSENIPVKTSSMFKHVALYMALSSTALNKNSLGYKCLLHWLLQSIAYSYGEQS